MRKLSIKAQIANAVSGANAHVTQVQGLNDTLREKTNALANDRALLEGVLSARDGTIRDQSASIAAFKQETLALHIQAAELRGYIARVLEDDAASDAKDAPVPQQDSVVTTTAQFMPRAVNDHHHTGPGAMAATDAANPWDNCEWSHYPQSGRNLGKTFRGVAVDLASALNPMGQRAPKHWTQR